MARTAIIEKVNRYLLLLKENGIDIDKAFLYGSFAKGEDNANSDIDVLLVSKMFDSSNDKAVGIAWKITRQVDPRIEPYLIGLKKFNNDEISPLLQIIKREGILLS